MSYREIRNLIEHTRALGFPRVVSVENFSTPNFPLLAEILHWALKVVDSEFEVSGILENEEDRVILVRTAAVFFYHNLGVKLNPVRLYGADRLAARELLKVTSSLYQATRRVLSCPSDVETEPHSHKDIPSSITGKDLREFRQLASSIVMDAASLHDSLTSEIDNKLRREKTLGQALDIDCLEATLVSALHSLSGIVAETKESTQQLEKQLAEVEEKILKRKESQVRNHRRLEAMNRIKPSWQTEFEREEAELRELWEDYIVKHKNLAYLEQQREQLDVTARLVKDTPLTNPKSSYGTQEYLRNRNRRVFGSMTGENVDESDSESSDSFLNDSASDDDSLTLHSEEEPQLPLKKMSPLSRTRENLHDYSLYSEATCNPNSGHQANRRPTSARPKSGHCESRVGNFSAWAGSVRGSERVSPLSASEDNSDGF